MTQPDDDDDSSRAPSSTEPDTTQSSSTEHATSPYAGPPQTLGYPAAEMQTASYGYAEPRAYPAQPGYGPGAQAPYAYGPPQPGYGPAAPGSPAAQPGYGPAGPGYPAAQPGYGPPQPGYGPPPPDYPAPYGYPVQRGPVRPGGATAAAVLLFIQASVVLISTFYVLFFASLASGISASGVSGADAAESEWTIVGILQLVSVGLLIFGGVQLLSGSGRTLTFVACGIQLVFVVYWMVRIGSLPEFDTDGSFFFVVALMYAVLPVVALGLAAQRPVAEYIAAKRALSSTAS